ncbi:vertebrate ancient opsin [Hydra vulgaris]|uniref:Vertebrate ancient opsin n=1 Tax=Hydra vulgaris TaxID=6087 RepID=A0ABM4CY35_HYDVU
MVDIYATFSLLYAVLMVILSTSMNTTLFYILIFKSKKSYMLPQLFISSISILDILQTSARLIPKISAWHKEFPLVNSWGCVEAAAVVHFVTIARVVHMVVLSFVRILALKNYALYLDNCEKILVKVALIFFCYLYGFLWAFLPVMGWSSYVDDLNKERCSLDWKLINSSSLTYIVVVLVFSYVLPGAILICVLKRTHVTVIQHKKNILRKRYCSSQFPDILANIYLKIFSCLTVCYFVTWTPYIFVSFITMLGAKIPPALFNLAAWFESTSSILGAFVNLYFNKPLKAQLYHIRLFGCLKRNKVSPEPSVRINQQLYL